MHRLEVIAAPSISYGLLDRLLLALEMELLLMLMKLVLLKLVMLSNLKQSRRLYGFN